MAIRLSISVEKSDVLRRLFYWNAFTTGRMLELNAPAEVIDKVVITMVGLGGFATDDDEIKTRR